VSLLTFGSFRCFEFLCGCGCGRTPRISLFGLFRLRPSLSFAFTPSPRLPRIDYSFSCLLSCLLSCLSSPSSPSPLRLFHLLRLFRFFRLRSHPRLSYPVSILHFITSSLLSLRLFCLCLAFVLVCCFSPSCRCRVFFHPAASALCCVGFMLLSFDVLLLVSLRFAVYVPLSFTSDYSFVFSCFR
jgi:hypothetical protein